MHISGFSKGTFTIDCCSFHLQNYSQSCQELIQHVYGFSLDSMYSEATEISEKLCLTKSKFQRFERCVIADADVETQQPGQNREKAMRAEHIQSRLSTGKYYRLTKRDECSGVNSQIALQVVCKHPERRAYVQRVCFLGKDEP